MIYGGPKVFVRLASQWNSLMMMMMIQHIQSATQSNNGITHTHTHFHAGQQQPSLSPRCRLPETDGAKSCQQSDQVGLYLVGIHQMAPPEHTSDKRAYYSLYVCMYVKNIYVRAEPYSIDCHRGDMDMYHCAWENVTDFSCTQNCVRDSNVSRTVSGSEFQRDGSE